ncbi:MAG: NAD(P)/FAD-dependent oxidoreductase [Candidatus Protistobacter heckmanni]|nr:NAD(P)/FAD-dependent oxidoreductase [Candidatus Protistobacter heckmanni]
MMCAGMGAQSGLKVALIDHAEKIGEKIRISGGGRCNFTNLYASPANFHSSNKDFCRSALARYTPADFLDLVRSHRIGYHEKHKGQLFCDESAEQIVRMLEAECEAGGVRWMTGCKVGDVSRGVDGSGRERFRIGTAAGAVAADALVVATGGLSIPKIGATDFGYRLAKQFGIPLVQPCPGLVPMTFDAAGWVPFAELAGISLEVEASLPEAPRKSVPVFLEDLLFTHRGLSGPAILQISSFWRPGQALSLNLLRGRNAEAELLAEKARPARQLATVLGQWLPAQLAAHWISAQGLDPAARIGELPDKALRKLAASLSAWRLAPSGTEGYRKAEVTCGGVDTRALSSASMMAKAVPGLYFIGEVMDVTGWLGGYNFQWVWASAAAAATALAQR